MRTLKNEARMIWALGNSSVSHNMPSNNLSQHDPSFLWEQTGKTLRVYFPKYCNLILKNTNAGDPELWDWSSCNLLRVPEETRQAQAPL